MLKLTVIAALFALPPFTLIAQEKTKVPEPEYSEATRLIEEYWNATGHYHVLPVGEVEIIRDSQTTGKASPDEIPFYEVLRQQTKLTITSNIDLTSNKNSSLDNFYSLTQQGVIRKLVVNLTSPEDKTLRCPSPLDKLYRPPNVTWICVDLGVGSIQNIVRSQKFRLCARM